MIPFDGTQLQQKGLNLVAVLNLRDLPNDISQSLAKSTVHYSRFTQLILIGHAGKQFWQAVKEWQQVEPNPGDNPVDDFSIRETSRFLSHTLAPEAFEIVYPGPQPVNLQALGELVGWHHETPMKLGINDRWGTWFAYRTLVLARSEFVPILQKASQSPCERCIIAPCVNACPVGALDNEFYDLPLCLDYRQSTGSSCSETCLARQSCNIGEDQKYSTEQIKYHYKQSLNLLRRKT
jgi:epoxyqueuosine reductase